jgi:hypothetical protein
MHKIQPIILAGRAAAHFNGNRLAGQTIGAAGEGVAEDKLTHQSRDCRRESIYLTSG